jgi:NADPH:quinone reductase-like Zn-dependent oxidoreductase
MKAAQRERYGPPETVVVREVDLPEPMADEVLVRVHAASVNRADLDYLEPRPRFIRLVIGVRAPRVPAIGIDVAGTVEAVGPAVTRFGPGDAVFADLFPFGQGAFAEFALAPERAFLPIPPGMSMEDAATLPHSAVLAAQALRRRDGTPIQAGMSLLIDGASGNVGPFAIQIAKARGAEVTAVASTAKLDFVRDLGADHVIDYTTTDYTGDGRRYDWIVAPDTHHSMASIRRVLRRGGIYVTLGGWDRHILSAITLGPVFTLATGRFMGLMLWWRPFHADDIATLAELYAGGQLRPRIDSRYPLDEVAAALRHVQDGRNRGKVLVIP